MPPAPHKHASNCILYHRRLYHEARPPTKRQPYYFQNHFAYTAFARSTLRATLRARPKPYHRPAYLRKTPPLAPVRRAAFPTPLTPHSAPPPLGGTWFWWFNMYLIAITHTHATPHTHTHTHAPCLAPHPLPPHTWPPQFTPQFHTFTPPHLTPYPHTEHHPPHDDTWRRHPHTPSPLHTFTYTHLHFTRQHYCCIFPVPTAAFALAAGRCLIGWFSNVRCVTIARWFYLPHHRTQPDVMWFVAVTTPAHRSCVQHAITYARHTRVYWLHYAPCTRRSRL